MMVDSFLRVTRTGNGWRTLLPGQDLHARTGWQAGTVRAILNSGVAAALLVAMAVSPGISQVPGTTDTAIFFGQSAPSSGTSADIGKDLRLGIEAAFNQVNFKGGIGGKMLYLRYLDDSYVPSRAVANVRKLLGDRRGVFGFIGSVGATSTTAIASVIKDEGIPLVAPVTGLGTLRDRAIYQNVINLRPSYQQEADAILKYLSDGRDIKRIGLLYQDDSFGRAALESITVAAGERGLDVVGKAAFPSNTTAVKTAIFDLIRIDAEAIVLAGTYEPIALGLKWAHKLDYSPLFISFSQVGSNALANALEGIDIEVYMTQILPDFADDDAGDLIKAYKSAIDAVWPGTKYGYVSFEGYLAGRLAADGLERCATNLSRECFMNVFLQPETIAVEDVSLVYDEEDSQGTDFVYLTAYDPAAGFLPVQFLDDMSR